MADFFQLEDCGENWRTEHQFGLYDPKNHNVAYSVGEDKLLIAEAVVTVGFGLPLKFVPVDNNKSYDSLAPRDEFRCDGFLMSASHKTIIFVELKNQFADSAKTDERWLRKAVCQLRATLSRFRAVNPVEYCPRDSIRVAYASNKSGGYRVSRICPALKSSFFRDTQYVLKVDYRIKIDNVI